MRVFRYYEEDSTLLFEKKKENRHKSLVWLGFVLAAVVVVGEDLARDRGRDRGKTRLQSLIFSAKGW